MEKVKEFLLSPDESKDDFWKSDALIWVDWGDLDDSIIKYFNDKLPDEDKIQFECIETEKERGVDIFLHKNGISTAIPYADDFMDRDITIKSVQKYLYPKYQIRLYIDSSGCDTLAFCIYPTEQWNQLEQEFGAEKVASYFQPIKANSKMF